MKKWLLLIMVTGLTNQFVQATITTEEPITLTTKSFDEKTVTVTRNDTNETIVLEKEPLNLDKKSLQPGYIFFVHQNNLEKLTVKSTK